MSMKRNVKVGLAVAFLIFLHNNKAMMITGAIMMVLGIIVSAFLGSVLVQDYT
jgi:predicted Na+-dependent transporter